MIKYLSPLKAQALAAGNNEVYTVPANTITHIRALTFHNTTAANMDIEVYLIRSNIPTVESGQRLVKKVLSQNESYLCPEVINHVLTDGMKVVLVGNGVNAMLSVSEQAV
ncbi:hypothetical protein [Acinetobacter sp. Marseille-Q1618]|uniref:hypothetical protein n=1 Tax=Acinetobacter sp. Marseille-Q1618 TaxID=2697502 RepID=UPI00156FD6FD|nr:hypothetical protein [Acinetobacter sp. Marseille-Q1618]